MSDTLKELQAAVANMKYGLQRHGRGNDICFTCSIPAPIRNDRSIKCDFVKMFEENIQRLERWAAHIESLEKMEQDIKATAEYPVVYTLGDHTITFTAPGVGDNPMWTEEECERDNGLPGQSRWRRQTGVPYAAIPGPETFLLFSGVHYEEQGGWGDFISKHASQREAEQAGQRLCESRGRGEGWFQVVNLRTLSVVTQKTDIFKTSDT